MSAGDCAAHRVECVDNPSEEVDCAVCEVPRECHDDETAHVVDCSGGEGIAGGVAGRDAAEVVWVVDDWCEEIDRLDERQVVAELPRSGVLTDAEEKLGLVSHQSRVGQDVVEFSLSDFARTAVKFDPFGETWSVLAVTHHSLLRQRGVVSDRDVQLKLVAAFVLLTLRIDGKAVVLTGAPEILLGRRVIALNDERVASVEGREATTNDERRAGTHLARHVDVFHVRWIDCEKL